MSEAENLIRKKYDELCTKRDAVNARVTPLRKRLDAANEAVCKAQAEATRLAEEIQAIRGGQSWIDLKCEIGLLAKALSGRQKPPE